MKKEIDTRKMQEKNGHRFLQLIFFSFMFSCTMDLITRRRKRKQGGSFLFPIILRGKVHIYWFKPITSRRGREFKDLDLWSFSHATFLFVEGGPLHSESHLLNKIILSLPNGV